MSTDRPTDPLVAARLAAEAAIDSGAIIAPDPVRDVVTVADRANRLTQGTVESLTEYDVDELPLALQMRLALWWVDFLAWSDPVERAEDEEHRPGWQQ